MPAEENMPLCPKAIAVSKPKRETWMVEELLDTLIPWDPDSKIQPSGFPGVYLVYTSLDPHAIGRIMSSGYHAFVKRIVPTLRCLIDPNEGALLEEIRATIKAHSHINRMARIKLIVSIRGSGKRVTSRTRIEEIVRSLGFRVDKKSNFIFCLESVNETFVLSLGEARFCGPDCIVVLPFRKTATIP